MSAPWTITEENAADYLRLRGWISNQQRVAIRRLTGGVSNEVFRVSLEDGDFVLKQARDTLRVKELWECDPNRIWRERDVIRICGELLDGASAQHNRNDFPTATPVVLFEDLENYVLVISAAPEDHRCWKDTLLAGQASALVAAACGQLLGRLHVGAWDDAEIGARLDDRRYFIDLRVDPYYRHVGRSFPQHREALSQLERSLALNRRTLVHGDFSPKNLLASETSLMLIDFEVGHFGDPAFDLGFFLTHLTLKYCWSNGHGREIARPEDYRHLFHAFWASYRQVVEPAIDEFAELALRARRHLAACGLSRLDGKSTVDYLTPEQVSRLRRMFGNLLHDAATGDDTKANTKKTGAQSAGLASAGNAANACELPSIIEMYVHRYVGNTD